MPFTAFPLRLERGFLKRCEEPEAILTLIRAMARTPHSSWSGSSHFGLRDLFEEARRRPGVAQFAVQELNLALQDLEITRFRVESITKESQADRDVDSYVVQLVSTVEGGASFAIGLTH
ncbi:MAG: hypothetical protein ACRD11_06505 [Terriglobia bacterium]